jgi:hypothetical protein
MDPIYFAGDMLEEVHQWRRQGVPTMRVSVLKSMFANHLKEGMVVMNVNGGPHFTYRGMVRASAPKFIISKLIHNVVHSIHQNCFVSISLIVSTLG